MWGDLRVATLVDVDKFPAELSTAPALAILHQASILSLSFVSRCRLNAMAAKGLLKTTVEAARVTGLAAHSAAGLAAMAGTQAKEALRLLRLCEALSRAATACLVGASLQAAAPSGAVPAGEKKGEGQEKPKTKKRKAVDQLLPAHCAS